MTAEKTIDLQEELKEYVPMNRIKDEDLSFHPVFAFIDEDAENLTINPNKYTFNFFKWNQNHFTWFYRVWLYFYLNNTELTPQRVADLESQVKPHKFLKRSLNKQFTKHMSNRFKYLVNYTTTRKDL